jgi:hypothetical protein
MPADQPQLARVPASPAQKFAGVVGTVLVLAGLVGFAADAAFDTGGGIDGDLLFGLEVNGWHNLVHIASGLLLLAGLGSNRRSRSLVRLFGVAYLVVTIVGLVDGRTVFGLLPVNPADNVFHALLTLGALVAAARSKDRRDAIAQQRVVPSEPGAARVVGPGSGHVGGPRATDPRVDRRLPVKKHP